MRYSGSPIPLSFSEVDYRHQVVIVDFEGERARSIRAVPIPRAVELLRVPAGEPKPLAEVLPLLRALPALDGPEDDETRPLLEVRVRCDRPEPQLRREVEAAVAGTAAPPAAHRAGDRGRRRRARRRPGRRRA